MVRFICGVARLTTPLVLILAVRNIRQHPAPTPILSSSQGETPGSPSATGGWFLAGPSAEGAAGLLRGGDAG